MAIKFANFARSTLAVGIGTGDTSIALATGTGARFPTLAGGDYFYATLENAALSREIVKVTARSTDTLTVVRAQDGTTAASWVVGDTLSLRLNAAAINDSIASVVHQSGAEVIINSVSGTNTITGTLSPTLTSYANGQTFRFVAAGANTGAVTINLDGLGAKAVTKNGSTALEAGDIAAGAAVQIMYDGTQFQLTSGAGGGGASAGGVIYENKRVLTSSFTGGTSKSGHMVGPLTINTGQTLTVPTGEALMIFNPSTSGTGTTDVLTTGAQTFQGQKTFALQPRISGTVSMVRLNTANGYGSTNTKIRRFTNVVTNQGSDITYADSATLGASFTINTSGVYSISYTDQFSAACYYGVTLNTASPTADLTSLPASEILAVGYVSAINAPYAGSPGATVYLPAGSVIRAHTSGTSSGANTNLCVFNITRVA